MRDLGTLGKTNPMALLSCQEAWIGDSCQCGMLSGSLWVHIFLPDLTLLLNTYMTLFILRDDGALHHLHTAQPKRQKIAGTLERTSCGPRDPDWDPPGAEHSLGGVSPIKDRRLMKQMLCYNKMETKNFAGGHYWALSRPNKVLKSMVIIIVITEDVWWWCSL